MKSSDRLVQEDVAPLSAMLWPVNEEVFRGACRLWERKMLEEDEVVKDLRDSTVSLEMRTSPIKEEDEVKGELEDRGVVEEKDDEEGLE